MRDSGATWLGLQRQVKPLVQAGVVLGMGLGGFFDGIVFHQILQWHHMVSSYPDPVIANDLTLNVLLDGLFHAVTYGLTIGGVGLLWRAWRAPQVPASGQVFFGSTLSGWGLFNVVEGLVNHHLLRLHHVWSDGPGPILLWDVAFLTWGVLFIGGGYAISRADARPTGSEPR